MEESKIIISKEAISFLKSVLTSQLLLEANEELVLTNRYKGALKQQINRVNSMLEPIVREEFDSVYNSDPEMTTNILNKIDSIISTVSKSGLDELVIIEGILNEYNLNKEEYLKIAQAQIDEIQ
jgi:hypothetical protein